MTWKAHEGSRGRWRRLVVNDRKLMDGDPMAQAQEKNPPDMDITDTRWKGLYSIGGIFFILVAGDDRLF